MTIYKLEENNVTKIMLCPLCESEELQPVYDFLRLARFICVKCYWQGVYVHTKDKAP